jgi:hypothetical protein
VPKCCWKGASAAMQRIMFRHFRGLGWGPRSRRLRLKRAAVKLSTDADLAFADDPSAPTAIKSAPPGTTDAPAVITVLPPGSIDGPSATTEAQAVATHGSHAVASALLVSPPGSTDGPSATTDAPAVATDGPHVTASAPLAAELVGAKVQNSIAASAAILMTHAAAMGGVDLDTVSALRLCIVQHFCLHKICGLDQLCGYRSLGQGLGLTARQFQLEACRRGRTSNIHAIDPQRLKKWSVSGGRGDFRWAYVNLEDLFLFSILFAPEWPDGIFVWCPENDNCLHIRAAEYIGQWPQPMPLASPDFLLNTALRDGCAVLAYSTGNGVGHYDRLTVLSEGGCLAPSWLPKQVTHHKDACDISGGASDCDHAALQAAQASANRWADASSESDSDLPFSVRGLPLCLRTGHTQLSRNRRGGTLAARQAAQPRGATAPRDQFFLGPHVQCRRTPACSDEDVGTTVQNVLPPKALPKTTFHSYGSWDNLVRMLMHLVAGDGDNGIVLFEHLLRYHGDCSDHEAFVTGLSLVTPWQCQLTANLFLRRAALRIPSHACSLFVCVGPLHVQFSSTLPCS